MKFTTNFGLRFQTTRLPEPTLTKSSQVYRGKTVLAAAFQRDLSQPEQAERRFYTLHRSSARSQQPLALGSSRFTRSYSGNPCLFLFLCLLICLSSAGSHTQLRWFQPIPTTLPARLHDEAQQTAARTPNILIRTSLTAAPLKQHHQTV